MDILKKSTILYVNQTRIESYRKLVGKGISESISWSNHFKKIIFVCYSDTNNYIYKKLSDNFYLAAIPFDLEPSGLKSIINIGINYLKLFYFLYKLVKIIKIDIIRMENVLLSGIPVYFICKIKRIPYVVWHGGNEIKSFKLKYKKFPINMALIYLIITLQKIILGNANFVFHLSHGLLDIGIKRKVKSQIVSPNFLDVSEFKDFHQRNDLRSNDKVTLIYVGRYEAEKGMEILFNSIKLLSKQLDNFEFLMVGYGSLENWMHEFIKKNDIKNVKFLGKFSHKEMPKIYNLADIFILPSHTETLTAALLEAMSCGCAIISTAVGDIPRLIKHGYNGYLVPPNNVLALTEVIKELINDKNKIKKFSKNGRETVAEYVKNYTKIHKYIYNIILDP